MVRPLGLPFDPIERAGQTWEERFGPASAMRAATSVFRVQQILLARFDEVLKPHGLTFARYEVLVLLTFSRTGQLPLSKIGERLMVHPTSVTNIVQRLEQAGLVERRQYNERPPRYEYRLTRMGKDLAPAVRTLAEWGVRYVPGTRVPPDVTTAWSAADSASQS